MEVKKLVGNEKPRGFAKKKMKIEVAQHAVQEAHRLEKMAGEALFKADEMKQKAWRYMQTFGHKNLDVEQNNMTIRLQSIVRASISYDIDVVKKVLPKNILNEVISKKYVVSDIETLKDVMKQYGVPANILKSCLEITESVDNKRMDQLYEHGHISIKQLEGSYTIKESITLRIKELYDK